MATTVIFLFPFLAVVQWYFTSVKYSLYTLMKAINQGLNVVVLPPRSLFDLFDVNGNDYNIDHSYQTNEQRNKPKNKNKSRAKKSHYQKF